MFYLNPSALNSSRTRRSGQALLKQPQRWPIFLRYGNAPSNNFTAK
jgi:hypothetical protein